MSIFDENTLDSTDLIGAAYELMTLIDIKESEVVPAQGQTKPDKVRIQINENTIAINALFNCTTELINGKPTHTAIDYLPNPVIPDTTAPVFTSASINGSTLILTYESDSLSEANTPSPSDYIVDVDGTLITPNTLGLNSSNKTVTLSLLTPVVFGQTVAVSYTQPNTTAALQDTAGNKAASLINQSVVNNTAFVPSLSISLSQYNFTQGQTATVTLTFNGSPVGFAEADITALNGVISALTVSSNPNVYTALFTPTDNIVDASNTISVGTGYTINGVTGVAAQSPNYTINTTTPDTTAPLLSAITVNGSTLILTYTSDSLDEIDKPIPSDFAVNRNSSPVTVTSVSVSNSSKTVTLALSSPIVFGDTVTLRAMLSQWELKLYKI